jgi:hypothetical protein
LRSTSAQGLGQIIPEFKQAGIKHYENAADIPRTVSIQVNGSCRRVGILGVGTKPFPVKKLHRYQGVEEVRNAARVQAQFAPELPAAQAPLAKFGKEVKLDSRQQDLRTPKSESRL